MAFRELCVLEVREVLRLWAKGCGYRPIASLVGVDRKTVRRYVEAARSLGLASEGEPGRSVDDELVAEVVSLIRPGGSRGTGAMREHCRTHRALLVKWAAAGCKGPKLVKLLKRHTGVTVPLRTLQRFMKEEVRSNGRDRGTVRVADGEPGEILEVDFMKLGEFTERGTGRTRDMSALLCTANFSRHQFVWPCLTQTQQDVIEGLEAAWQFFGGVFTCVVSDNLRPVVSTPDPLEPKLNPTFIEYMQARDFVLDPARVRKPQDKARVERQVQFVRDDFFGGEQFGSLEEARRAAEVWCRVDAGEREHGTTRRQPIGVFKAEELPHLEPAPTEPYDQPVWMDLSVGRDHAVVVDYALYSVPYTLDEGSLRVRLDRASVKFYRGAQLVKVHPRVARGKSSIDPADLPPGKAELATRDGEALCRVAEQAGTHVSEYARRLLDDPRPWSRMRHVYRLLGLAKRYGGALVDEACAQALALDVVDVMRIDRMLERGLVERGLLQRPPPPTRKTPNITSLRFARDAREWRPERPDNGDPDAPA